MKRKKLLIILAIYLITTSLISCGYDIEQEVINIDDNDENLNYLVTEKGQVILPLTNFKTLNPLVTENAYYYYFSKLIFEGLFEFDEKLSPKPQLASTYSIGNDGRSISIKLRENVLWHDGEEFTTEDVEFTINTLKFANVDTTYKKMMQDALGDINIHNINNIINVRVIDKYNIIVDYDIGFSNNLEILTFPIIPKHIFSSNNNNQKYVKALETDSYIPIGTGPFKFENYDKFKSITLKAFENYRDGKPSIETVIGKVLDDEELILTSFETGQISLARAIGVDWDKYKNNSRIKVIEFLSNNYEFLGLNFENQFLSSENGLAIRQAMYYGINRQDIIRKVFLGHGTQIDLPINPDSWLISNNANSYGYNAELAKNKLNGAGFKDIDGDGILEDEFGNKLTFRLLTNSYNPLRVKMAEMIRNDLKSIGINITLDVDTSFKDDITEDMMNLELERINSKLNSGDFDIVLSGWQISIIPELSFFYQSNAGTSSNFSRYKNETMDKLLTNAISVYSREEKLLAYEALQQFIMKDIPNISLFFTNNAILVDSSIVGDLNPTFYNPYKGLERSIKTSIPE